MSEQIPDSGDERLDDLDSEQEGENNSGLKKIILILSVLIFLIAGITGGLWVGGVFGDGETVDGDSVETAEDDSDSGDEQGRQRAQSSGIFYELPQILVNLSSSGRRASFLKITLSLELASPEDLLQIEKALPRITDTLQVYLRELRPDDLKGSSGVHRLREELLIRLDASSDPVRVQDILFKELLIQ